MCGGTAVMNDIVSFSNLTYDFSVIRIRLYTIEYRLYMVEVRRTTENRESGSSADRGGVCMVGQGG